MKRRRHTPEQVIWKPAKGEKLLGEGRHCDRGPRRSRRQRECDRNRLVLILAVTRRDSGCYRRLSVASPCRCQAELVQPGQHLTRDAAKKLSVPSSPPSGSSAAATWTSRCVSTTGDPARSFYDGHGHPFSLSVEGWHGRSGSERRAVQACCCKPGQSPQLGDGTCRCRFAAGGTRSTTPEGVTGLQVRPNPPALPKLFGTSSHAVDSQRSINERGHPSFVRREVMERVPRPAAGLGAGCRPSRSDANLREGTSRAG